MKSLLEFIESQHLLVEGKGAGLSKPAAAANVPALLPPEISADAAARFASQLVELVGSHEYLEKLSTSIGRPWVGESKEEFVTRSMAAAKELLKQKLKNK